MPQVSPLILTTNISSEPYDARAIVINDVHVPHQDDKAIYLFEELLTDLVAADPKEKLELIIGGDFLDCFDISTFAKIPGSAPSLRREIELGHQFLKEWRRILGPRRRFVYVTGNHELRLRKHVAMLAPEIYDIVPTIDHLLDLAHLGIEWVDLPPHLARFKDAYLDWHGVLIGHFDRYSKHSAYTAKAIVEDKGCSIVQGHTHRAGVHWKKMYGRLLFGIENGLLGKLTETHEVNPNWQQAVTILTYSGGVVSPQLLVIDDYRFCYGNKLYTCA